jgi:hypothetical protein
LSPAKLDSYRARLANLFWATLAKKIPVFPIRRERAEDPWRKHERNLTQR